MQMCFNSLLLTNITTSFHNSQKNRHRTTTLCILYSNRSNCYSKMGDMENCAKDCNAALEINPAAIKPLVRRAAAYEAMEKYVTLKTFHFLKFPPKSSVGCCHNYEITI